MSDKSVRKSGKRPKKRRFHSNQYTRSRSSPPAKTRLFQIDNENINQLFLDDNQQPSTSTSIPISPPHHPIPTTNKSVSASSSRSTYKLVTLKELMDGDSSCDESDSEETEDDSSNRSTSAGFRIISLDILKKNIESYLTCKRCHRNVEFLEINRQGLGSEFKINCKNKNCRAAEENKPFPSNPLISVNKSGSLKNHSVNRRSLLAMRAAGGGHSALKTFCGMMDLPPPVHKSSFQKIRDTVSTAVKSVQEESMKQAGIIEYKLADNPPASDTEDDDVIATSSLPMNIDVSVDGTYMTRGFSSKIGVVSCIGAVSGKVLDIDVKSKVCKKCEHWSQKDQNSEEYQNWKKTHEKECTMTHEGSSGSMESALGVHLFGRSLERHNLRYTRFIGDGDTNSFKKVSESKPYGDAIPVEKLECVGHVQKRIGTRLRKLKTSYGNRDLEDGKKIGGKGRLTKKQIDDIQNFFGNAIRGNKHNLEGMRKSIWSIYFHKLSTNEQPYHKGMCDPRWCKYLKADKEGKQLDHDNSLPVAILDVMKPIFRDLTHPDLLRKCLEGFTQNSNESLNNMIWNYCPKNKYHGMKTVEIAIGLAVTNFNDGAVGWKNIFNKLELEYGQFSEDFLRQTDRERLNKSEVRTTEASLEARRARRNRRLGRDEADAEDGAYACGEH